MDLATVAALAAGLMLLVAGGELLVRGAARLAAAIGVSPLVVGLTVVAFGTSAPELFVSAFAAATERGGIALGNVLGSNVFNVLCILGVSALITPLTVDAAVVRRDVPLVVAVSGLVWLLASDGRLGPVDGLLLVAGVIVYALWTIRLGRAEQAAAGTPGSSAARPRRDALLVVAGLGALVLGSHLFVRGAVAVATAFGVGEQVIGLTIVAAGTSLPELTTSIVAARRGERDIAVGNIVGSNLFNLLAVLGTATLASGYGLPVPRASLAFDFPVATAVAGACLPVFVTGHRIERWEGALFLGYYVAYTAYLVLAALGHAALPLFATAMLGFVVPLTAVTLVVTVARRRRG